jgi:hypothetical protein
MASISNTNNSKCWQGCREKETFYTVGGKVTAMESNMEVPQKTKNRTTI